MPLRDRGAKEGAGERRRGAAPPLRDLGVAAKRQGALLGDALELGDGAEKGSVRAAAETDARRGACGLRLS